MAGLTIPTIVEGHGEVKALPLLIRRLGTEIDPQLPLQVPPPIRVPRSKLVSRPEELERAVSLACLKGGSSDAAFLVVLLDSDDDCPAELGTQLLDRCRAVREDFSMSVVLAKREFEAWFLAAAESLRGKRSLPDNLERPENPESIRNAKGWIKERRADGAYSETLDQPAYAALFNIVESRTHSPSFDKFCRDFERLVKSLDY